MKILADSSLPGLNQAFPEPFKLTLYKHSDDISRLLPGQDVLLCRSTLKVDRFLLQNHHLSYVATASSGSDHLDKPWLNAENIQFIDAKGSNARAVTDYVVACLAYLDQQNLIHGKTAGIIGMGTVGTQVATRLRTANFKIIPYDPPKAVKERLTFQSGSLEDLYQADLLCIHAELHATQPYPSIDLINDKVLAQLKPGCIILNAARGGIVNEKDLLHTQTPLIYCTDVYLNEPSIDKKIIDKATLCTPHIAGHSLEAKYAAVFMLSKKLHQIIGLPLVEFISPKITQILKITEDSSWQELVLKLYNPLEETRELKQALDKKSAFLSVRQRHRNRHDFSLYTNGLTLNKPIRSWLGT